MGKVIESEFWSVFILPNQILRRFHLYHYSLSIVTYDTYSRRPQSEHGEPDLGEGDLKEFQAILAKDDEDLDEADEEFMWSKRENLRSFPEALPKVLLSAPEKNYTG